MVSARRKVPFFFSFLFFFFFFLFLFFLFLNSLLFDVFVSGVIHVDVDRYTKVNSNYLLLLRLGRYSANERTNKHQCQGHIYVTEIEIGR